MMANCFSDVGRRHGQHMSATGGRSAPPGQPRQRRAHGIWWAPDTTASLPVDVRAGRRRWPGPTTGRPGYAASNVTVAAYLDPKTITLTVFRLRYGEPDCLSATGSECAVVKRANPDRRGSVRPVRCLAAGELPEAAEPQREHDLQ